MNKRPEQTAEPTRNDFTAGSLVSLSCVSQTNMVMVAWKAVGYRPVGVARHRSHTTPSLHCRTSKLYTQKAQIQACADSHIVYWRMCNRLAFARHHHLRQRLTEFPCRTHKVCMLPGKAFLATVLALFLVDARRLGLLLLCSTNRHEPIVLRAGLSGCVDSRRIVRGQLEESFQ